MDVIIKDFGVVTPFGIGPDSLWENLAYGKSAIAPCERFDVSMFDCKSASILPEIPGQFIKNTSLIWNLITPLQEQIKEWDCDVLILATTKGDIDLLENALLAGKCNSTDKLPDELTLDSFRTRCADFLAIPDSILVSAACASSNSALAVGAEMLLAGRAKRICVVGVDIVSKFVFSGFSALQALSSANFAKPFDRDRDGLIPGEACGAVLLTCEPRNDDKYSRAGTLLGWGGAADANHITGPSRDGSGLVAAIQKAVDCAELNPATVGAIAAHGTATRYNDAMEMHAFRTLFNISKPTFSVKGALGHTMGASGILETIISLLALKHGFIPPTTGFEIPDELSEGWVSAESANFATPFILKTNSGFGGVNSALLLGR